MHFDVDTCKLQSSDIKCNSRNFVIITVLYIFVQLNIFTLNSYFSECNNSSNNNKKEYLNKRFFFFFFKYFAHFRILYAFRALLQRVIFAAKLFMFLYLVL